MSELKFNVSFGVLIRRDSHGAHGYIDHPNLSGVAYGSDAQIKNKLKALAEVQISEALRQQKEVRSRAVGCVDGTVLVIQFRYDAWSYCFAGPNHPKGGCVVGGKDFDDVLASAKRHAEQSYGGVAWESGL